MLTPPWRWPSRPNAVHALIFWRRIQVALVRAWVSQVVLPSLRASSFALNLGLVVHGLGETQPPPPHISRLPWWQVSRQFARHPLHPAKRQPWNRRTHCRPPKEAARTRRPVARVPIPRLRMQQEVPLNTECHTKPRHGNPLCIRRASHQASRTATALPGTHPLGRTELVAPPKHYVHRQAASRLRASPGNCPPRQPTTLRSLP